jgi:hypothetical protein
MTAMTAMTTVLSGKVAKEHGEATAKTSSVLSPLLFATFHFLSLFLLLFVDIAVRGRVPCTHTSPLNLVIHAAGIESTVT